MVCFGLFWLVSKQFVSVVWLVSLLYTETERFDVLIEPKQTEDHQKQLIGNIFLYFFRKFRLVPFCFGLFWFVSKQFVSVVSLLYRNREFRCLDRTETNRRPTETV